MIIAARLRGTVKSRTEIEDSLGILNLRRKMWAVVVPSDPSYKGMLQKVKDWVTWGEVGEITLEELLRKRGRKSENKKLTSDDVKAAAKLLKEGKTLRQAGLKPVLRLTPPSGGFKNSIKQHWPRGELGYRGKEMEKLIKRMM